MKRETFFLLLGALVLVAAGTGIVVYNGARGLRNNNPGNIRKSSVVWKGQAAVQDDPAFVKFIAPEWGIRAMGKILNSYFARGLTSVQAIVNTWAPPTENDTGAYVAAVARQIGVEPSVSLTPAAIPALVAALIHHENGSQPYTAALINQGVGMSNV